MEIKVKDKPHKSIHRHVQSYPMLAAPTDSKHGRYQNYYSLIRVADIRITTPSSG